MNSRIYRNFLAYFLLGLFYLSGLFLCGCSTMSKTDLADYNTMIASGDYISACEIVLEDLPEKGNQEAEDKIKVNEGLNAATCLMEQRSYDETIKILDRVESVVKRQDEEIMASKAIQNVGAVLVNDNVLSYTRNEYDGILLNAYKAKAFMAVGDSDLARVEFNRALERQRRAKEYFSAQLEKQKKAIEQQKKEEKEKAKKAGKKSNRKAMTTNAVLKNDSFKKALQDRYSTLDAFAVYPDFVNPYVTYLAGLFFMLEGDMSKSRDLLKEAYVMNPNNPAVLEDFKTAENLCAKGTSAPFNTLWVIYENGLSAQKTEWEINLPLFVGQAANVGFLQQIGKVGMLTMALPELEKGTPAHENIILTDAQGETLGKTTHYASMDAVIAAEFKKRYPVIVSRAVTSSLTKALIQYIASDQGGIIGTIAGSIYAVATNEADTRMWEGLPMSFDIARVKRPKDGELFFTDDQGNTIGQVGGLSEGNHIIFIRQPTSDATPAIHVVSYEKENT